MRRIVFLLSQPAGSRWFCVPIIVIKRLSVWAFFTFSLVHVDPPL